MSDIKKAKKSEISQGEHEVSLVRAALEARRRAYAPYSHFAVGAALLCGDGQVYQGANIENASYGATNCAERSVFFRAVGDGRREFRAIAIAGGSQDEEPQDYAYPCGICRQVMQEFCEGDFQVIVAKSEAEYKCFSLKELLPWGFGGEELGAAAKDT